MFLIFQQPSKLHAQEAPNPPAKTRESFRKKGFLQYAKLVKDLADKNPYKRPNSSSSVDLAMSRSRGRDELHLLIGCSLRGRELGCVPAVTDIFSDFIKHNSSYTGRLTVFFARSSSSSVSNPEPNRAFNSMADDNEKLRADELKDLLKDADLFIEISQKIDVSEDFEPGMKRPFFVLPQFEINYLWAKYLQVADTVIFTKNNDPKEGMTMQEYAQQFGGALGNGIPSLSLHINQKDGTEASAEESYASGITAMKRAMQGLLKVENPSNVKEVDVLAREHSDLKNLYTVSFEEPFRPTVVLNEGLKNFKVVEKGFVLGKDMESNQDVVAAQSGLLFSPKYYQAPSSPPEIDAEPIVLPVKLFKILEPIQIKNLSFN